MNSLVWCLAPRTRLEWPPPTPRACPSSATRLLLLCLVRDQCTVLTQTPTHKHAHIGPLPLMTDRCVT